MQWAHFRRKPQENKLHILKKQGWHLHSAATDEETNVKLPSRTTLAIHLEQRAATFEIMIPHNCFEKLARCRPALRPPPVVWVRGGLPDGLVACLRKLAT